MNRIMDRKNQFKFKIPRQTWGSMTVSKYRRERKARAIAVTLRLNMMDGLPLQKSMSHEGAIMSISRPSHLDAAAIAGVALLSFIDAFSLLPRQSNNVILGVERHSRDPKRIELRYAWICSHGR